VAGPTDVGNSIGDHCARGEDDGHDGYPRGKVEIEERDGYVDGCGEHVPARPGERLHRAAAFTTVLLGDEVVGRGVRFAGEPRTHI
jgi:hypothetical protein